MEANVTDIQDPGPGSVGIERGEDLVRKLAGYAGPSYRKVYLSRLLKSGMDLLSAGSGRSAAYCLDKVESELQAAISAFPGTDSDGAGHPPRETPRPLEALRLRWREERVRKAEAVLERHGPRLSSLERRMYREGLAKWSKPSQAPSEGTSEGSAQASPQLAAATESRADNAILELRRRLYGRILKTQKAEMSRRPGGRALALVPVHEAFPGRPVGPYNDRHNLEGVINLLAQADPAWVEEFLELYRKLAGLKGMIPALPAALRK